MNNSKMVKSPPINFGAEFLDDVLYRIDHVLLRKGFENGQDQEENLGDGRSLLQKVYTGTKGVVLVDVLYAPESANTGRTLEEQAAAAQTCITELTYVVDPVVQKKIQREIMSELMCEEEDKPDEKKPASERAPYLRLVVNQ
jgi:hypothetical protein